MSENNLIKEKRTNEIPIELRELLHNLKDRDWDVNSTYKMDKNEAKKIVEAIEKLKE